MRLGPLLPGHWKKRRKGFLGANSFPQTLLLLASNHRYGMLSAVCGSLSVPTALDSPLKAIFYPRVVPNGTLVTAKYCFKPRIAVQ